MAQKTDLSLSIGYWIVSHKQTLRTWWAILLMAIIAGSLFWSIYFFAVFFSQDRSMTQNVIDASNGIAGWRVSSTKPADLRVDTAAVIVRDDQHVDVVATLTNSNVTWGASVVTAHFVVNGQAQPSQTFFLNPSSARPIMQLNVVVTSSATVTAEAVIDATTWVRVSASSLPTPQFRVSDVTTTPSTVTIGGVARQSVTITASVSNASVYNFYHVTIPVVVYDGERVVGATEVTVDRWATLTSKPLSVTMHSPIVNVTRVDIQPQVSQFDIGNVYR
jgi:hypothetical protein